MMDMVQEIYQQVIVDHSRNPRNFGILTPPCHKMCGQNPVCGDNLDLYLRIDNNRISAAKFSGDGCAIAMSSASLLTEVIQGISVSSAIDLFNSFHASLTSDKDFVETSPMHSRLKPLLGVKKFPVRVKCATLAWQTMLAIIESKNNLSYISTE